MTAPRVVVETPRPEPCTYAGSVVPHMDRRVLQAGEYVLIEKVDGEWPSTPEWPGQVGDGALVAALNTFLRACWANDGIEPFVAEYGTYPRGGERSNFDQSVLIVHAFLDALVGGSP